jgi:hypothetical protein
LHEEEKKENAKPTHPVVQRTKDASHFCAGKKKDMWKKKIETPKPTELLKRKL